MKAHQITEPGLYWYFPTDGKPEVVEAEYADCFWRCGNEISHNADELPGEFIGPLVPPNRNNPLARE